MNPEDPNVLVIDDDESVRRSLARLLRAAGYRPRTYASAVEFLSSDGPGWSPGCLVLDLHMPGMDGLALHERLREIGSCLATVFITGRGDVPTSVRAMKGGAVDFLEKPFGEQQLLDAVALGLERSRSAREQRRERESIESRLATLTPRETEVLQRVVTGRLNKEVAAELGTVEKTIKVHRARVMEKMQVTSLAELVRLMERVGKDWTKVQ